MIPELKAKLWTARTPDRWHPIHVAGTDNCVALVAPDQRELAKTIEGLSAVHEQLGDVERLLSTSDGPEGDEKGAKAWKRAQEIVTKAIALLEGSK